MSGKVNYIKHLQAVVDRFDQDDRLSPWHISLYYALFQSWNRSKFNNPISINREDMMSASKIGSANTYTKTLKELDAWGYISYQPSKNRWKGSKVYMYSSDNSNNISTDKSTAQTKVQEPIKHERPSINNTNNKKPSKPLKEERAISSRRPNPEREVQKDEGKGKEGRFAPPPIDQVQAFFLEEGSTANEAENYHNYFESNGWLVGGKAKMKNWKAAARNWIKRSANFSSTERSPSGKKNYLDVNQDKDYSIPL